VVAQPRAASASIPAMASTGDVAAACMQVVPSSAMGNHTHCSTHCSHGRACACTWDAAARGVIACCCRCLGNKDWLTHQGYCFRRLKQQRQEGLFVAPLPHGRVTSRRQCPPGGRRYAGGWRAAGHASPKLGVSTLGPPQFASCSCSSSGAGGVPPAGSPPHSLESLLGTSKHQRMK
jgi:hypothetical protein